MKDKNLAVLFKYFAEGKVTEYTLCSEIEDYLSTTLRTQVELYKGTSTNTFLVSLLPIKTDNGYKVKYIIDKAALDSSIFTDEDIVACLDNLKDKEQELIRAFNQELKTMKYNEVSFSEMLCSYLKIYRMGASSLPYDVRDKAISNKMYDPELVDLYIEKLESYSEKLQFILEELGAKNVVPVQFIDEAKKLVSYQVERRVVIGDPGVPDLNMLNTVLGHQGVEDDIFSGGKEVKELIMEEVEEDLKKN